MRFRFRHISILIALTICFSIGCSKSENDERLEKDNALIERELKSKKINFTKHNNVYHAIQKKGYGYMVAPGDSVAFWYVGYIFGQGNFIFDTNVPEIALKAGLDTSVISFDPIVVIAGDNKLIEGIGRGLMQCREKEFASIYFSSILGFGGHSVGPVPAWSPLGYDILIFSVINNHIKAEQKSIANFVSQNEGFVQDTIGFWKRYVSHSISETYPSFGDTIYGWYRERILNGEIVNEAPNEGKMMVLDNNNSTEGLMFGFMQMSPTDRLELVVPSSLGYGIHGISGVPPYTPLFYELRLDSIK